MAKQELEILAPAGIPNQTPLDHFTHNVRRAGVRRQVVDLAVLFASTIQTNRGAKVRLSLAANPEKHSKAMRGVMRSVVAEGLWLYQCAPDGENPITWMLDHLADQLAAHEVVVAEYRDSEGVQQRRKGIVSPAGFQQAAEHLRAALDYAERVQRRADNEAYKARQARRDQEAAEKAAALKAAIGLA